MMEKKTTSDDFYGAMKKLAEEIKEKKDADNRSKGNKPQTGSHRSEK